jgi:AcrR family transcriptional regulator
MIVLRSKKQDIREAILHSARAIAESEGWPTVTVRAVASKINYAAPVIYEHFASKDDLLLTIAIEGYDDLYASFQAVYISTSDPTQRLLGLGKAYWEFAMEQPKVYELLHDRGGILVCNSQAYEYAAKQCMVMVVKVVEEVWGGEVSSHQAKLKAISLWALLHGLVTLTAAERITKNEAHAVLNTALDNFIKR